MKFLSLTLLFITLIAYKSIAQTNLNPGFDQREAFSALPYLETGNPETRSVNGSPGPKYWQNRADYKIRASLDTMSHTITASAEITYLNNSPDKLPYIWLQVDQNIFRDSSRASFTAKNYFAEGKFTGGYQIKSITVKQGQTSQKANYIINDTRMQVRLSSPLQSNEKVVITIDYSFSIPGNRAVRMSRMNTPDGWIYQIAQWYPRVCVYDDLTGWNTLPYLVTGEFFLEYGDFDVTLDLPANQLVSGSGELLNAKEVLSPVEFTRLQQAANSEATVAIRTVEDLKQKKAAGRKIWHFSIKNARDMTWAASSAFLWDAARINLPGGKKALAQSLYPAESAGKEQWGRSVEFIKGVVEYNSKEWYPYPYPNAVLVAGKQNGMEYPGMVFTNAKLKSADLFSVVNHEFGHFIFPIIVGSNERKYTWMDEGLNTFLNILCANDFNKGEFKIPEEAFNFHEAAKSVFGERSEPVLIRPDVLKFSVERGQYSKVGVSLILLRDEILGRDRFDYAFKKYIANWAYKHPAPADFFRSMDNGAGEDLGWFWKAWFINNWKLDQAVTKIEYTDNDPLKGSIITLENLDKMVMPAILEIKEANGNKKRVNLPIEIWQKGGLWTLNYPSSSVLESVIIDPDKLFPDINPVNNTYKMSNR